MDLMTIAKGTDYGSSLYTIFKETEDLPKPAQEKKKVVPKPSAFSEPPAAKPFDANDYIRESAEKAKHSQVERHTGPRPKPKKLKIKVDPATKKALKATGKVAGGALAAGLAWKLGARKTAIGIPAAAAGAAAAKPAAKWGLKKLRETFTNLSPETKKKVAVAAGASTAAGASYGAYKASKVLRRARNARSGAGAGGGVGGGGSGGRWRRGGGGDSGGAGGASEASSAASSRGIHGSPLGWGRQYRGMSPAEQAVVRRRAGLGAAAGGGAFVGADLQHRRNHAVRE